MPRTEARRWRRPLTAAALVLLWHGLLLLAWLQGSRPQAGPGPAPVLRAEWLNLAQPPPAAPPPPRPGPGAAAPKARPGPAPATPAPPAPPARPAAALEAPVEARTEAQIETRVETAAPPPSAAAPNTAPALRAWSPEALAEGLRRERQWQDRQGRPRPARDGGLAPRRDEAAAAGAVLSESRQADGARWARVQGPLGTYCVRLPPPGSPLPEGPGPRLALPGNCP